MNDLQVAALEAELVTLRKRSQVVEDKLNEVEFGPFTEGEEGLLELDIKPRRHAAVMALAESLMNSIGTATNYVSIRITHPSGPLEATVQRVGPQFLTPHQARDLAEAEVKRLLSVCAANGINETTTLRMCGSFVPENPEPRTEREAQVDAVPWCRFDAHSNPNALFCLRCGDRQELPEWKTAKMAKVMHDVFLEAHCECIDVNSTNDNDDDGAE